MSTQRTSRYSMEEYLALERDSEAKHEFWNGEVFVMSGGTLAHDQIAGNLFISLKDALRRSDYQVFTNTTQIKVPAALPYRYADCSVVCGPVEVERFNGSDLLLNPTLICEVLSPTTEAYDRGDKFTFYKSIPAFREYLLIAQHRVHVTHYVRQASGIWSYQEVNEIHEQIELPTIGCQVLLSVVYDAVSLQDQSPEH